MTPSPLPSVQDARSNASSIPVTAADLDTQIEQLEQRLVAREVWLRSTAESLARRTKLAVTPKPWVLPVVGAGVVLWLGWRWWHRRDSARPVSVDPAALATGRRMDGLAGLPWAGLTSLGWPLVPVAWRGRLSPAAAAAVISTVVSVARRLLRRRGR